MDKYVRYFFITQLNNINLKLLKDDNMKLFSLYINNFMVFSLVYVVKNFAINIQKNTNGTVTVKDVPLLQTICTIVQSVLKERKYENFITILKKASM